MALNSVRTNPRLYLRYIDDIFCVFSKNVDFKSFLNILNSQHKNLKFTYEEGNQCIPFLDTKITLNNGNFESLVYRKATNTDVLLNFEALCPINWKIGLVKGVFHRAWNICSSYVNFNIEIEKLFVIFMKNGYPKNLLHSILKKFLYSKFETCDSKDISDFKFWIKIPYVGKPSLKFKNDIVKLFKSNLNIDISCVFVSFKVGHYFSLKCDTPKALKSKVVYKFSCLRDAEKFYIGKTKRHLAVRVLEHIDLEKNKDKETAIFNHIKNCSDCNNTNLSINNFEILTHCKSDFEAKINEAMLIQKFKPILNDKLFESGKSFLLNVYN